MAVTKITEKTVASALKDGAHFLVTQPETVDGSPTEALRRVPISMVREDLEGQMEETYAKKTVTDTLTEDVSTLKSAINDKANKADYDYLTEAIELVESQNLADPSDTEPGGIGEDGSYNSASGYYRTKGYISIEPSTEYYSKYPTHICYYNSEKGFISRISTTNTGASKTTPQNAYYVKLVAQADPSEYPWRYNKGSTLIDEDYFAPYYKLSGELDITSLIDTLFETAGKCADAKATGDAIQRLDYLTDAIEECISNNLADPSDTEPGAISDDGTYNTASGYYRTKGYIDILPNTEYYSKYPVYICYYNAEKGFISRISTTNTGASKTTPQNAYFAKLIANADPSTYPWRYNKGSSLIDEDYFAPYDKLTEDVNVDSKLDDTLSQLHKAAEAKATGDAINTINAIVNNIPNTLISLSMIQSIGIIGDSFASGYIYANGSGADHYQLSWGQILGRDIGASTVDNYSKAGEDTESWLTDNTYGLNKLNSTTANQLYIIALGINDAARNLELGTIDDIESDSTNSFYSWYGRIVRAIQNHAPNAIVMLSTNARFGTGYNRFSDAIKSIGTYYSFPVLDLSANSYFNSQLFINAQVGEHPTAIGYAGMAKAYKAMIEQALGDNYASYMTFVG